VGGTNQNLPREKKKVKSKKKNPVREWQVVREKCGFKKGPTPNGRPKEGGLPEKEEKSVVEALSYTQGNGLVTEHIRKREKKKKGEKTKSKETWRRQL